ncbi:MAG TPA: hypothetical protein VNX61_13030, partial [Rhizomicrobium sp.]|nr:hypothetical protein [Rhizomicrobium sp.]
AIEQLGGFMRHLGIAVIVASLAVSPLASAQPLSPGKPAGVHAARRGASTGLLIAGTVLAAGLIAVVAINGSSNNNSGVVTNGVATTTS